MESGNSICEWRYVDDKLEDIRRWMEGERGNMRTVIGGDFNARVGELGGKDEGGKKVKR